MHAWSHSTRASCLLCPAGPLAWASGRAGPSPKKNKKQKNRKIIKKTKMCVCINKKNKYEFVIFIH
jgi:hypothetical protein